MIVLALRWLATMMTVNAMAIGAVASCLGVLFYAVLKLKFSDPL